MTYTVSGGTLNPTHSHSYAEFDRKYLRNGLRYQLQETALLPTTPPALSKKICELWSTNSLAPMLAEILKAYVCLCLSQ